MLPAIAIAALLVLLLASRLWRGGVTRSREEVAQCIEDFLQGRSGEWDWDDFTSVRIKDPYLDRIRRECIGAEGNKLALRALIDELRGRAA